jgi:hypothetical protein
LTRQIVPDEISLTRQIVPDKISLTRQIVNGIKVEKKHGFSLASADVPGKTRGERGKRGQQIRLNRKGVVARGTKRKDSKVLYGLF